MEAADPASPRSQSEFTLGPVEVPKASDVLAEELRERILTGELAEGDPLPAERELVKQAQMSRATVREALRMLEVQNLIRIKAGRTGGAFVQLPTTKSMANSVSMLIRGRRIKLVDLMETREALEPFCAQLAARNRTDEDLAELCRVNEAIADPGADLAKFPAGQSGLARGCGSGQSQRATDGIHERAIAGDLCRHRERCFRRRRRPRGDRQDAPGGHHSDPRS
jgi:GntR family transcriptional regulator, transcriptional repressor for pyruvate dehydrogenase complex